MVEEPTQEMSFDQQLDRREQQQVQLQQQSMIQEMQLLEYKFLQQLPTSEYITLVNESIKEIEEDIAKINQVPISIEQMQELQISLRVATVRP